ncbi:MAG: PEGA domain-containing protein, partial [Polyangiaceae bacterium]
MTAKNKAFAALLALATCLPPNIAFAQGASNEAAAQALFDQARTLMQSGKLAEACAKFAESNRLSPGAGTMLNLGACYEKNGQTASAWATYADAASAADKANRKDWATRAKTRMAALAPDLSKLTITVPVESKVDGLEVKRDDVVVGETSWGVAIPVDPGAHVVSASAPGYKPWTTNVQIGAKKAEVAASVPPLQIDPAAAAQPPGDEPPASRVLPPPAAPPPEESSRGDAQRYVGVGVGAVGVVGIGLGAVFGILASSKKSDAAKDCNADLSACNDTGVQSMDSARSRATISTVGFIAGGALLAAGVVLFVTAPKGAEPKTVGIGVTPNGNGASLAVGGAW